MNNYLLMYTDTVNTALFEIQPTPLILERINHSFGNDARAYKAISVIGYSDENMVFRPSDYQGILWSFSDPMLKNNWHMAIYSEKDGDKILEFENNKAALVYYKLGVR